MVSDSKSSSRQSEGIGPKDWISDCRRDFRSSLERLGNDGMLPSRLLDRAGC